MRYLSIYVYFLFSSLTTIKCQFNFLAIGDWGGSSVHPYYTIAQKHNAIGMGKVAEEINAQIVISLGDNFYKTGVSDEDVELRYRSTFEEVYDHPSLVDLPWYAIAGNHDYYGNITAQIQLSQKYPRWKFPNLFHEHTFTWTEFDNDTDHETTLARTYSMQVILIDTAVLAGLVDRPDIPFMQPPGPSDPEIAQFWLNWLEDHLERSTADYIWIGGHYPIYSVCWQGSSLKMIEYLDPLLHKYGAHYMAGHDHCQLHLVNKTSGVNYLLTGMGHSCCYGERNDQSPPGSLASLDEKEVLKDAQEMLQYRLSAHHNPTNAAAGFASIQTNSSRMKILIHNQDGDILYSSEDIPPRYVKYPQSEVIF